MGPKINVSRGGSRGESVFLLVVSGIPWLMATSLQGQYLQITLPLHIFSRVRCVSMTLLQGHF